jgi:hypothetical protein
MSKDMGKGLKKVSVKDSTGVMEEQKSSNSNAPIADTRFLIPFSRDLSQEKSESKTSFSVVQTANRPFPEKQSWKPIQRVVALTHLVLDF